MTAASRAQQIAELAEQVAPLGNKARGMRLAADDWNQVVQILSALLRIDQQQDEDTGARLDEAYARKDHQHLGEVTLEWLDASLQSRLASGGESAISVQQALAAMQKTVTDLRDQVARLTERVEKQQATIDNAAASQIDHIRQLTDFEKRFAGLESLRVTIGGIAKSQEDIGKSVKTVLDFRGSLTNAAGGAIDFSTLTRRIGDLETMRDSLTGVDGKLLRLRDLQVQMTQLSFTKAPGGGIPGAPQIFELPAGFQADLEAKLTRDGQTRIETLRGELLAADAKVADTLTGRIDKGLATTREATLAEATGLVKAAETRLGASVTTQVTDVRKTLSASLREQADAAVGAGLAGIDTRIDTRIGSAVDSRVAVLSTRLATDLDASLTTKVDQRIATTATALGGRLAAVETNVAAVTAAIPVQVDKRVATAAAALQVRFDSQAGAQATALQQSLGAMVDQKVTTGIDAGLIKVRTAAAQTVADGLGDLDTRIATSVKSATRTLPDQIATQVKGEIAQVNIPGQIAAANGATAVQLRSEIAASAANVTAVNTTALTSAVTNLRGEIGSASATRVASPIASPVGIPVVNPAGPVIRNPRITPG